MKRGVRNRVGAGFIALAMVLSQVLLPAQSAYATHKNGEIHGPDPTNNTGIIKVREASGVNDIPDNSPMLASCSVVVDFYNFNNTAPTPATVEFKTQAPTSDAVVSPTGPQVVTIQGDGDADGEGSNDLDGSYPYSLSFVGEPKSNGTTSGYKVTVDVNVDGTTGGPKQKTFWMPASCRTLTTVEAAAPTKIEKCGTAQDMYTIPTKAGVEYFVGNNIVATPNGSYSTGGALSVAVTARALAGFTLTGASTWSLGFTNVACNISATPDVPTTIEKCGTLQDMYTIPATTGIEYLVNGEVKTAGSYSAGSATVTVTARATTGYVLDGTASWTLRFTNASCICTVSSNTYSQAWTYNGATQPQVGASPSSGVSGTYDFTLDGLLVRTPDTESYVNGRIDAGLTRLVDIDTMSYTVMRAADSTGNDQVVAAYRLNVDLDGDMSTTDRTNLYYEPIYNGTVVTGEYQIWDVIDNGDAIWWSKQLTDGNPTLTWEKMLQDYPNAVALNYGFNQGTYNRGTNTYVKQIQFDCALATFTAEDGGLGGDPILPVIPVIPTIPVITTPVVPTGGAGMVLPAELPMTGTNGSVLSTWIALLAAILTYGSVYYLQPKKRFEQ